MRKIALLCFVLLFGACSQKNEIKYYLPDIKTCAQKEANGGVDVSVDTVSYLSGDRIWYKKDGVFLPYKNSYLAKTHAEFIKSSIESYLFGSDAKVKIGVTDSYQAYLDGKNEYVFAAKIEIAAKEKEKIYRFVRLNIGDIGAGPKGAVDGLEKSVANVCETIKTELKKGGRK